MKELSSLEVENEDTYDLHNVMQQLISKVEEKNCVASNNSVSKLLSASL
jgi:hypothetical protein